MTIDWEGYLDYLVNIRLINIEGDNFNTYKSRFLVWQKHFEKIAFTLDNCERFKSHLKLHDYANSTVNNYVKLMRSIADYLKWGRVIDIDTYESIKSIRYLDERRLKEIDILSPQEIKKIATVRMEYGQWPVFLNYKWKVIFYTLGLGMRIGELCNIRWEDINNDSITITSGKTVNAVRKIAIPEKLYNMISKVPHYPHGYVFGSHKGQLQDATVRIELKRRLSKIGITKHITPHTFRYSYITNELSRDVPLDVVMSNVGHSDPKVTLRYKKTSFVEKKKAIESNPLYSSNTYEKIKEVLHNRIDSVHNKEKLKAISQLLIT